MFQECVREILTIENLCSKDDNFACLTTNCRDIISPVECDINIGAILQNVQIPDRDFSKLVNNNYHNFIRIYTDGSKIEGVLSTGATIVCQEMNHRSSISMSANASVFTAECVVISEAMNLILLNYNKFYLICLDSSAIMCLNSLNIKVKTNKYVTEIKQKLSIFKVNSCDNNRVVFMWIPSHCGVKGNELADKLAKEVAQRVHNRRLGMPFSVFEELFRKRIWASTTNSLELKFYTKGRQYYNHFYEKRKKPWFFKKDWSRDFIVRVGRLRSNHYNSRESLARVNIIHSPVYECTHPNQDLKHIFCEEMSSEK